MDRHWKDEKAISKDHFVAVSGADNDDVQMSSNIPGLSRLNNGTANKVWIIGCVQLDMRPIFSNDDVLRDWISTEEFLEHHEHTSFVQWVLFWHVSRVYTTNAERSN